MMTRHLSGAPNGVSRHSSGLRVAVVTGHSQTVTASTGAIGHSINRYAIGEHQDDLIMIRR